MISDFHTHTEFSADSEAEVMSQIEQAVKLGMKEICITDHNDYDVAGGTLDFFLDLPSYVPRIQEMKKLYRGKIVVNLGMELGLQLHIKDYLERVSSAYPFDFIIGSSHFVDGRDPFHPEYFQGRSAAESFEEFFRVSLNRVRELDCFDVLGHMDYIVRYSPGKNQEYHCHDYWDMIHEMLRILIERGKGIECNTGGYHYGLGEPNPCGEILAHYRELGGEIITVGSDAHAPSQLGYGFGQAEEVLKSCGFRYYTVFHERKAQFIKL